MSVVEKPGSSSSNDDVMAPRNNHDPTSSGESGNTNVEEADLQEMEDVNQSLDALSCALDAVEQRTDDILSQLRQLLDSNREIRRQLAEDNAAQDKVAEELGINIDSDDDDDSMDGQACGSTLNASAN